MDAIDPADTDELWIEPRKPRDLEPKALFCYEWIIANPETGTPDIMGFALDPEDPGNQIAAIGKRFACRMKNAEESEAAMFKEFAAEFIGRHFQPLQNGDVMSRDEWFECVPYTEKRKDALRRELESLLAIDEKTKGNNSFGKRETYMKRKFMRAINSYLDSTKPLLGPIIKSVEKAVFKAKWFVKGSNPRDWPLMMDEAFGVSPVMENDFTSFEAHHRGVFAEIMAGFFDHMLAAAQVDQQLWLIESMILGVNFCEFSKVTARVKQRLMSGAMWTSLANGVLNLLIMAYLNGREMHPEWPMNELAARVDEVFTGFIEGDDGICLDRLHENGELTASTAERIERLGLRLTPEWHEHYGEASFCGCVCVPGSAVVVQDVGKVLRNFFNIPSAYLHRRRGDRLGILRAKAMSYYDLFGKTPVVGALAWATLRNTAGVVVAPEHLEAAVGSYKLGWVDSPEADRRVLHEPTASLRDLVERKFGWTGDEQVDLETQILQWRGGDLLLDLRSKATVDDLWMVEHHFHVDPDPPVDNIPQPWRDEWVDRALAGDHKPPRRERKKWRDLVLMGHGPMGVVRGLE